MSQGYWVLGIAVWNAKGAADRALLEPPSYTRHIELDGRAPRQLVADFFTMGVVQK